MSGSVRQNHQLLYNILWNPSLLNVNEFSPFFGFMIPWRMKKSKATGELVVLKSGERTAFKAS